MNSYRLPAATHVGVVRLQVGNLARSVEYYTTIIGFRVISQHGGVATLASQGDDIPLVELHERPGARPVPHGGLLGLYHFAILVPDRASLGRFVAHLADVNAQAGAADHWVSEALYLTDPDGLGIEVYADRPRSQWRVSAGELAMGTEPLDVRALVQAAGGSRWEGLPTGTVIGHVHLHVGALPEAEAFYHLALGLDKTVSSYPGALFLSAGGYHHHLGTNVWATRARPASNEDARLLEWELVVPDAADVRAAAHHVAAAGYSVAEAGDDRRLVDPWGTALRLVVGSW